MAADLKKLLIRSIDKIVFLGFLVFFVWQAFKFVTTTAPPESGSVPKVPNKPFREEPALFKERFVLRSISDPLRPDARYDLTTDPEKIEPGPNEKQCPRCGWIVPQSMPSCPKCRYRWEGVEPVVKTDENDGKKTGPVVEGIPFKVVDIAFKPVDILFFGFIRMPGRGLFLQINFANNTRTNMVPEGGFFQDYRLSSLVKKEKMVQPPGFSRPYKKDAHFITIQKEGGQPIEIERGQTVTESMPVATLQALAGKWQIRHGDKVVSTVESIFDVYAGDTVSEVGGQTKTFEIVRVEENRVRLKDREGKEHDLPRGSGR